MTALSISWKNILSDEKCLFTYRILFNYIYLSEIIMIFVNLNFNRHLLWNISLFFSKNIKIHLFIFLVTLIIFELFFILIIRNLLCIVSLILSMHLIIFFSYLCKPVYSFTFPCLVSSWRWISNRSGQSNFFTSPFRRPYRV